MINNEELFLGLSGLTVNIHARFGNTKRLCSDYLLDTAIVPDISISVSAEDIEAEKKLSDAIVSDGYCESICIYRAIAEKLPHFDRAVFHGAAVEVDGDGYIFTAPSGTGKTTHIKSWLEYFSDKVKIINGDKPILRLDGEKAIVCSTPWAGKEGLQRNVEAPIRAITLIKQSRENKIKKISPAEYFSELVKQFYLPRDIEAKIKTLDIVDRVLKSVPIYLLECDISLEAAELSFNTLTKI